MVVKEGRRARSPRGEADSPRRSKRAAGRSKRQTTKSDDDENVDSEGGRVGERRPRKTRRLVTTSSDEAPAAKAPVPQPAKGKAKSRKSVFDFSSDDEEPGEPAKCPPAVVRKAALEPQARAASDKAKKTSAVIELDNGTSSEIEDGGTKKRKAPKSPKAPAGRSKAAKPISEVGTKRKRGSVAKPKELSDEVVDFSSDDAKPPLHRSEKAKAKVSSPSNPRSKTNAKGSAGGTEETKGTRSITAFLVPLSQSARMPSSQEPPPESSPSVELWVDKHTPSRATDLAVNPKKVAEVEAWLKDSTSGPLKSRKPRILFLTGPSGSGKTATVRALCNDMNLAITEWINPENERVLTKLAEWEDQERRDEGGLADKFGDFLRQAVRYELDSLSFAEGPTFQGSDGMSSPSTLGPANPSTGSRRIILVEDVPNIAASKQLREDFHVAIRAYACNPRARFPLVIIASEIGSGWDDSDKDLVVTPRTVLPMELRRELPRFCLTEIHFNEVAHTFLVKMLRKLADAERVHVGRNLGALELDAVANRSGGDVRCAINALQFMSTMLDTIPRAARVKEVGKKKIEDRIREADKLLGGELAAGRESTLPLFHALGKILYNKRLEPGQDPSSDVKPEVPREAILTFDPEDVISSAQMPANVLVLHLSQNYPSFYETSDELAAAADFLSESDEFLRRTYILGEPASSYGAVVATRGLLWSHTRPVPTAVHPDPMGRNRQRVIHKPEFWQRNREVSEKADQILALARGHIQLSLDNGRTHSVVRTHSASDLKLDTLPYCGLMNRVTSTSASNNWRDGSWKGSRPPDKGPNKRHGASLDDLLRSFTHFSMSSSQGLLLSSLEAVGERDTGIDAVLDEQQESGQKISGEVQVGLDDDVVIEAGGDGDLEDPIIDDSDDEFGGLDDADLIDIDL